MGRPGMPNPNQIRSEITGLESAVEGLRGAISELKSKKVQIIDALNNPMVPPEQKAQYRAALANIESQIQDFTEKLAMYEGAIKQRKNILMQMAGMMSGAVHAESGANRG